MKNLPPLPDGVTVLSTELEEWMEKWNRRDPGEYRRTYARAGVAADRLHTEIIAVFAMAQQILREQIKAYEALDSRR